MIIDTSELSGRQLRERLYSALDLPDDGQALAVQLISFGYKHGIPLEADMVFDVRFMENPFYIDRLRPLNGLDREVREFVLSKPITERFVEHVTEFLEFVIPGFRDEGRSRLTVGFRLHRRPASLGRDRGGGRAPLRESARRRSPSGIASSSAVSER